MNLRVRLALVVAVTFALVVIGCTYAAHVSASRQLRAQTDDFLLQRSARFTRFPAGGLPPGGFLPGLPGTERGREREGPALADPDALTQILTADGAVASYITGQPELPIDATDKALARHG